MNNDIINNQNEKKKECQSANKIIDMYYYQKGVKGDRQYFVKRMCHRQAIQRILICYISTAVCDLKDIVTPIIMAQFQSAQQALEERYSQ